MRLKTKFQDEDFDLGEVVEANIYHGGNGGVKVIAEPTKGGMITFYFETLKGMNEMFEDAPEEPKGIQCIYYVNHFDTVKLDGVIVGFGSKEEAELAVKKLKAWKRLRDKGFRFDNWDLDADDEDVNVLLRSDKYKGNQVCVFGEDLDLLFGGEE